MFPGATPLVMLMAGLAEPVSSKVTVSPVLNVVRSLPLNQSAVFVVSQVLFTPSPRQTRFFGI